MNYLVPKTGEDINSGMFEKLPLLVKQYVSYFVYQCCCCGICTNMPSKYGVKP